MDQNIDDLSNFNLRVNDLPILDLGDCLETDGYLDVYFTSNTRKSTSIPKKIKIQIPYNRHQTAEELRHKIEQKIGKSTKDYYLVSDYGMILNGTTLDEYFPLPKSKPTNTPISFDDKPKIDDNEVMIYKSVLLSQYEADRFEERMDPIMKHNEKKNCKNKTIVLMKKEDVRGEYLEQREKVLKERENRRKLKKYNVTQSTVYSRADHGGINRNAQIGKSTHLGTFVCVKK